MKKPLTLSLISCLLLLTACSKPTDDLDQWMKQVEQRTKGNVPEFPTFVEPPSIIFIPPIPNNGPFSKAQLMIKGSTVTPSPNQPDANRPKKFLEQYDLEKLVMIGFISNNREKYAMIRLPDGGSYPVRVGDLIGTNYGRVTRISESQIDITETVAGAAGWETRPVSIQIATATAAKPTQTAQPGQNK